MYSIQRYYLKQDVPRLESGWRGILQKNHIKLGHDIKFGLMARQIIQHKELNRLDADVLNGVKFQQFLQMLYPKSD